MHTVAQWVADAQPEACVVDVSVEVALFLRLLGIPTVVVALPGERTDAPHVLVHRVADHIIAAWPAKLNTPHWLQAHAHKTSYVGGISRFEDRTPTVSAAESEAVQGLRVLVLGGAADAFGEAERPDALGDACTALGGASGQWAEDPWPHLCRADVVVSHAGQSSVADIAAARRPAVIVPQHRPFNEQHATATMLHRQGLAVTTAQWPSSDDWPALLRRACASDPRHWRQWQVRGAAGRAAAAIEATAVRCHKGRARR